MATGEELIAPFTEGVSAALREMAGVEAALASAAIASGDERISGVAALLPLYAAAGPGRLILGFPQETAVALARRILQEEAAPDMVSDCMGEVANVVAGQAKTLLLGTPSHFTLGTPVPADPAHTQVSAGWRVLRFETEVGPFAAYLDLPS
jgi:CheY-specific phosphatase CheX